MSHLSSGIFPRLDLVALLEGPLIHKNLLKRVMMGGASFRKAQHIVGHFPDHSSEHTRGWDTHLWKARGGHMGVEDLEDDEREK